jgi:hypothetical protein
MRTLGSQTWISVVAVDGLDPCQPNGALLFTCAVASGEKPPNETSYRVRVSEVLTRYCQVQSQQNHEAGGRFVLISSPEG